MKQKLYLAVTVLALLGGLALSQVQRVEAPASADALLYWFGDSQRELTRLPMVYTRIPDKDEVAAGNQMARLYGGKLGGTGTDEEKLIQKYVESVGRRLATHAKRKLPYQFHFVPDPDFLNAFAVPGGHVFIGGGLIAQMDSEDELANVLGHEVEHIDHYHCAERLQLELALRKLPMGSALAIPVLVFQAGYTKEQEFEADREGTALARAAGYSAAGAVRLFEKFERLRDHASQPARTPQEEVSQVARDILRGYFRSHPAPRDRIEQLKRTFQQDLETSAKLRPLEVAYVYIRLRADRKLQMARADSVKSRAAERYREAAELAAKSLALTPDQPEALRILALAQLGLAEYDAAGATYRQLVKLDPSRADIIRQFADELALRAISSEEYKDAAGLARFLLSLQPNQPAALRTLAVAQVGLGEFAAASETSRKLGSLYPVAGPHLAAQLRQRAAVAAQEARHADAVRLLSLAVELDRSPALVRDLAERQFDAAEFAGAARTYKALVAQKNVPSDLVMGYAEALGAEGRGAAAAAEYRNWSAKASLADANTAMLARIESAGLDLLASNESPAEEIVARATSQRADIAPEYLARLSRWYRKANRANRAMEFLQKAAEMRPGDAELQLALAWAEMETGEPARARESFLTARQIEQVDARLGESPELGIALAEWMLERSEPALTGFDGASGNATSWLNPAWVRAVASTRVAGIVTEILSARSAEDDFYRANFSAAREKYRALLEKRPGDAGTIRRFAEAVSAISPAQKSVADFESVLTRVKPATPQAEFQARLDLAGLKLLAGDGSDAAVIAREASGPAKRPLDARSLARLAWWHFRAGATPTAVEVLLRAELQRVAQKDSPDGALVRNALGWLELERNLPRRAYEMFQIAGGDPRSSPGADSAIGSAVALWKSGGAEKSRARVVFQYAVEDRPHWMDARWVEAMCPAHVASALHELQEAEFARRKEAERRAASK